MDMLGGKLTGGIFAIVGLFVAIVAVGIIVAPIGGLVAYFDDSAEFVSGSNKGTKFSRVYTGVTGDTDPTARQINTDTKRAGGSGYTLVDGGSGKVQISGGTVASDKCTAPAEASALYNEQGHEVGSSDAEGTNCILASSTGTATIKWTSPPEAYNTLSFLNTILVALMALMVMVGIIIKTKSSYDAFQSQGMGMDLTARVMLEVGTLIIGIVAIFFAAPILNLFADSSTSYINGQYDFSFVSSVLRVVISVVPTILILGVTTLVSGLPVGRVGGRAFSGLRGRFGRRRMAMGRSMGY